VQPNELATVKALYEKEAHVRQQLQSQLEALEKNFQAQATELTTIKALYEKEARDRKQLEALVITSNQKITELNAAKKSLEEHITNLQIELSGSTITTKTKMIQVVYDQETQNFSPVIEELNSLLALRKRGQFYLVFHALENLKPKVPTIYMFSSASGRFLEEMNRENWSSSLSKVGNRSVFAGVALRYGSNPSAFSKVQSQEFPFQFLYTVTGFTPCNLNSESFDALYKFLTA